jgi:uridine kinase
MIIIVGGAPCSGKSTLTRNMLNELCSAEYVEPMKLFPCEKRGDVLVVGRYPENETFGGTDRISYGAIPKFRDFIDQEVSKYTNIILEGDRFFRAKDIEWLLENHDAKVFVLTVSDNEEKRRHVERQDTQTEKWLKGRRTQIRNIMTNSTIAGELEIRSNETDADSQSIKKEIITIMQGTEDPIWKMGVKASNDNEEMEYEVTRAA